MFNRTKLRPLSPDAPELRAIAELASVAPARLATALNEKSILGIALHLTPAEAERLKGVMERLSALFFRVRPRGGD